MNIYSHLHFPICLCIRIDCKNKGDVYHTQHASFTLMLLIVSISHGATPL